MNGRRWWHIAGVVAATALAAFGPSGCDSGGDPDTGDLDGYFASHPFLVDPRGASARVVSVSPQAAQIDQVGGKAVFTAAGGSGSYTWDVANPSMGSIAGNNAQGVYTALIVGNNDVIVYDSNGNAAIANIGGTPPEQMTISADPESLAAANSLSVLTVSGGQPPYTWSITDPDRGEFPSGNTGVTVVYRRTNAGDNAVSVTDAIGNTASIVIEQP